MTVACEGFSGDCSVLRAAPMARRPRSRRDEGMLMAEPFHLAFCAVRGFARSAAASYAEVLATGLMGARSKDSERHSFP